MTREGKIIIAIMAGVIFLVGGLALWLTSNATGNGSQGSFIPNVQAQGLDINPTTIMDVGDIAYTGGVVSRSFDVKNDSGKDLKLRKIVTSCMCTTAEFTVDGTSTNFYGMEMNGDLNPLINVNFPADSTGQVIFKFDPAAHGLAGIGTFDRVITLFYDTGYKDFEFSGTVTN